MEMIEQCPIAAFGARKAPLGVRPAERSPAASARSVTYYPLHRRPSKGALSVMVHDLGTDVTTIAHCNIWDIADLLTDPSARMIKAGRDARKGVGYQPVRLGSAHFAALRPSPQVQDQVGSRGAEEDQVFGAGATEGMAAGPAGGGQFRIGGIVEGPVAGVGDGDRACSR